MDRATEAENVIKKMVQEGCTDDEIVDAVLKVYDLNKARTLRTGDDGEILLSFIRFTIGSTKRELDKSLKV